MRNKKIIIVISILVFFQLTCCITNKKLIYLQNSGTLKDTTNIVQQSSSYKIHPYDNLYIRVVTPDPKWSDMFNTMQTATTGINVTELSADLISYSVDGDGYIELPYAGKFLVSGKSLGLVKTELENALKGYVSDAAVTVKMINNYISIIGEVRQPGKYQIYKDRMNIFQALAMAGDLGDFSNRQSIQVIRQTNNGSIVKEFSLIDRDILKSEFFYVMPNDVIYAKPVKGRFFSLNSFPYSTTLSAITAFILLLNVIRN
jgi:polysaccharide export outer membrane protein